MRATPPTTDHPEFPSSNKQALSGRATESRLKSIQSGIAGFAFDPITAVWFPEISIAIAHLRDVLGDHTYESFARKGYLYADESGWNRLASASHPAWVAGRLTAIRPRVAVLGTNRSTKTWDL